MKGGDFEMEYFLQHYLPVDLNELNRIVTALEEMPDGEKVHSVSVARNRYITNGEKPESEELARRLAEPTAKRFSIDLKSDLEGRLEGREGGPSSITQHLAFVLAPEGEIDSDDIDSRRKRIKCGVDYWNFDKSGEVENPEDIKSKIEHTFKDVDGGYAEKMVNVYGLPMELESHGRFAPGARTLKYREFFDKTLEDL